MFKMSRTIGIDAGHRVPDHASKCKNLHGHRYTIEAHCESRTVISEGEQTGMVFDFSFMKRIMLKHIDGPCDHGTILFKDDELLPILVSPSCMLTVRNVGEAVNIYSDIAGKLYVVNFVPTAENLAKHWFDLMCLEVHRRSNTHAALVAVIVHETPNGYAEYRP